MMYASHQILKVPSYDDAKFLIDNFNQKLNVGTYQNWGEASQGRDNYSAGLSLISNEGNKLTIPALGFIETLYVIYGGEPFLDYRGFTGNYQLSNKYQFWNVSDQNIGALSTPQQSSSRRGLGVRCIAE